MKKKWVGLALGSAVVLISAWMILGSQNKSNSSTPALGIHEPAAVPSGVGPKSDHVDSGKPRSSIQDKLALLDEVLAARDDNDPRVDADLKILTREEKHAFMDRYKSVPLEDRNARGMIVFLIGRNLTSPEDFNFLNGVFLEPYCRSLENCAQGTVASDEEAHHSSGDEVTLSYPQWAAIKAIEKWSEHVDPALKQSALDALKSASGFDHPKIQAYAKKLFQKCGG